jgi:A/G-specific adenine glycosylase
MPPETMAELLMLPGVGMYTAAAWLSLHRGKRAVIIDANVARWLSRLTGLPYNRDPRHVRWVQELADHLTPRRAFRDYNYAVLDFTMSVCAPRPRCDVCPVLSDCWYGRGGLRNDSGGA